MQTLHVIMNQQHIDPARLPGKIVVVLDVLFATTTIAMALAHGARDVLAVPEVEHAREAAALLPADSVVMAGEKDAVSPPGFATFAPAGLSRLDLAGKRLVLVSTNGTVALANTAGAATVYTAALVNISATVERLRGHHGDRPIILVCAASRHRFNIEDFLGAGAVVDALVRAAPGHYTLTDAAKAAQTVAACANPEQVIRDGRVGRMVQEMGYSADLAMSVDRDRYSVVPMLRGGCLVAA